METSAESHSCNEDIVQGGCYLLTRGQTTGRTQEGVAVRSGPDLRIWQLICKECERETRNECSKAESHS